MSHSALGPSVHDTVSDLAGYFLQTQKTSLVFENKNAVTSTFAKIFREALATEPELVDGADDAETGPVDFGELLKDVLQRTRSLHSDMAAIQAPTQADLETLKARLEDLQKGDLARICDAGPRVQQRYGMKGFAEIFSPLSAAERKLNRMWAALVDQHWPEALASVALAQANLEVAVEAAAVQSKPAANS